MLEQAPKCIFLAILAGLESLWHFIKAVKNSHQNTYKYLHVHTVYYPYFTYLNQTEVQSMLSWAKLLAQTSRIISKALLESASLLLQAAKYLPEKPL